MPEEPKEPTKEGFKLQWAESDGQASAQSVHVVQERTNIEATTPEKTQHTINEVSYINRDSTNKDLHTKRGHTNEISYIKRKSTNEADARMRGKSMVTQSSSNHVPIEVTNTEKSTDTRMRNGTSTMGNLSITENQHIMHQPIQTEDCHPDDMESTKTKRSVFKSSPDNKPKHNKGEKNMNLLLATNSCTSHPASKYRPKTAMLGHDVKLPPNLLEHYPKPGKPPDDYRYIMAMRDHNTMVGERQYEEGDRLMKIRRGSKFDPGPFTTTEGLGPAVYRIRSQKSRVAHDQLELTVEGTPKWVN